MNTTTPLPDHAGIRPKSADGPLPMPPGPAIRATMSMDDLAKAQAQIEACVRERDELRARFLMEQQEHNRTRDRLQLVQNELEKSQADTKMYMRTSVKFATLVGAIHKLSAEAAAIAAKAAEVEDHLMEGETAQEREDATKVAQRFAPEKREAYDPNLADGYAQKDGKTVLVREDRFGADPRMMP